MPELQCFNGPQGQRIIGVHDKSLPVVRFGIAINHGTDSDPLGHSGLWRITLEMLMRGSEKLDRAHFASALETLGSALYCSAGRQIALVRGITLKRNWQATIDLAHQALNEPAISASETQQLIDETIDELAQARDDDATVAEIFWRRLLYKGHASARSPAGEPNDLRTLSVKTVKDFWQKQWLQRNTKLWFVFAGDLRSEEAVAFTEQMSVAQAQATSQKPQIETPAPVKTAHHVWLVEKPERVQSQIRVGTLVPPLEHVEATALWLGTVAFGGIFTSPFTKEIRDVRGWSYGAYASYERMNPSATALTLSAAPATADTLPCLNLMHDMFAQLCRGELEDEIIDFARAYLLNRFPFRIATPDARLWSSMAYVFRDLEPNMLNSFPEMLKNISNTEVRNALRKVLFGCNVSSVVVGDAGALRGPLEKFSQARDTCMDVKHFREALNHTEG